MADEIDVRLGGDNSSFRAMLDRSSKDAEKFAGEIAGRVSGKLTGMKDISNALAAALGFNLQNIAENVARLFTGMSKEVEQAYKQLDVVGAQVADANIKNMRALLTEEQIYALNLRERDKLQKQIADTVATTAPQQLAMKQTELKLAQTTAEILAHEKKVREELAKVSIEAAKKQFDTAEKSVQTQFDILEGDEKIAALKQNIADTEAIIASGLLSKNELERFSATLAERKNELTKEEAKAKANASEAEAKHNERMIAARQKEIDDKRSLMTVAQQMAALKQDEIGWEAVLADMSVSEEVRQHAQIELEKTRDKMRDLTLKKRKEEKELAELLLIPENQRTEGEKLRLQVLQGTVTQKELEEEKTRLMAGLVAGTLTEAEKNRLRVLMDQKTVLDQQLATAQAISTTVDRRGKGVDQQSDDSLEGVRNRLRTDVQRLERERFGERGGVGRIGGAGMSPEETLLRSELFNLEKEMRERQEVRDFAGRFGETKARQKFGDTLTDKALRDFNDQQGRATTALEDIQQRLEKLFPKR